MTKRYLGLLAILMMVLFLISSASGQSKPRKARTSSPSTKQPNGVAKVGLNQTSTTKPKTEAPFIGNSDDGSSIRQKQPRNRHTNQATATQINTNPVGTVNANKPGNNQSRMNVGAQLGIKSPEKSEAQVGLGVAGAKQKQPRKRPGH